MSDRKTGRNSDQFNLRLPEGMRSRIAEEAHKSGRSMNAEIVHRLANSLNMPSFENFALGLGDDLDGQLALAADRHGRTLMEEVIARLEQTFMPYPDLISELIDQRYEAEREARKLQKLFMQLTPEERRRLEERAEILERARELGLRARDVGSFVELNPIGKRERTVVTVPRSDYSPIFGDTIDGELLPGVLREVDDFPLTANKPGRRSPISDELQEVFEDRIAIERILANAIDLPEVTKQELERRRIELSKKIHTIEPEK